MRRVAVTGIGIICGLGKNIEECWEKLSRGQSGIRNIESLDTSKLRFHNGSEVPDYVPIDFFDPGQASQLDRFAQFALIAAREAIGKAGLTISPELSART